MIVGVLALQGDFQEHIDVLSSMKVEAHEVRTLKDLEKVDALILPGGESTVMAKFLAEEQMVDAIQKRAKGGMPILGTCAGAILLAKNVTGKHPPKSLGLLDITIERNAYGTQHDSFETTMKIGKESVPVSFIRAPKITKVGKSVEVLATYTGQPVLVRQGSVMTATFHTETERSRILHQLLLA